MAESASGAPRVFLHIGTPKSGTTYLQTRLARNHERAAEQGLLWPGPSWGVHVRAARDLRRLKRGQPPDQRGDWSELASVARSWSGSRVLISMEWLIDCTPHQIQVALESLQPCRVEVVISARDLLRTFVAQYQEMTKNYRPWTWEQFVTEVRDDVDDGPSRQVFWRQQDVPIVMRRWLAFVPNDRVHLVTVPPAGSDPELLWTRFCAMLGIDGTGFDPAREDNQSLGVVSTTLMQHLNVAAQQQATPSRVYKEVIHRGVGRNILASRRTSEGPLAVSDEMDGWLRRRADRLLEEVRALDVDVVGDLDDLVPGAPLKGREPSDVDDSERLAVAVDALVTLGVTQQTEIRRLRGANRRLRAERGSQAVGRVRHRVAGGGRRALRTGRRALRALRGG